MKRIDVNDPRLFDRLVGANTPVGPDIEAPGWNQTYASPFITSSAMPWDYNGPWRPDFTAGVRPRTLGRLNALPLVKQAPLQGCTACGDDVVASSNSGSAVLWLMLAGIAYFAFLR